MFIVASVLLWVYNIHNDMSYDCVVMSHKGKKRSRPSTVHQVVTPLIFRIDYTWHLIYFFSFFSPYTFKGKLSEEDEGGISHVYINAK